MARKPKNDPDLKRMAAPLEDTEAAFDPNWQEKSSQDLAREAYVRAYGKVVEVLRKNFVVGNAAYQFQARLALGLIRQIETNNIEALKLGSGVSDTVLRERIAAMRKEALATARTVSEIVNPPDKSKMN